MAESRHYNAFISYRHLDPDAYVAEKLQKLLENYRPPAGVGERDKIEYVFLDRAELPTSKSLDRSLKDALNNSDFLIVILSEKYKESVWCMEEIRVFKEIHGGSVDRILPVLVKGEPAESLPEEICFEEYKVTAPDGSETVVRKNLEPLCCDVRADSRRERDRKLKTEFLRLAAPMLGCGYDDLYQRHNRQKRRRQAIFTGAAFALLTAILAVVLVSYYNVSVSRRQYRQSLLSMYTQTGTERSCASDSEQAMAYYAKVLRDDPKNQNAGTGALLELQKQGWIVRAEDSAQTKEEAPDGSGQGTSGGSSRDTVDVTVDADEMTTRVTMPDGTVYIMNSPLKVHSEVTDPREYSEDYKYAPSVQALTEGGRPQFVVYFGGYLYLYEPSGDAGSGGIPCSVIGEIDLASMFAELKNYNLEIDADLYPSPSQTMIAVRSGSGLAMTDVVLFQVRHTLNVGPFNIKDIIFAPSEDFYGICMLASTDFGNNGPIVEIYDMDGHKVSVSEKDTRYDYVSSQYSADGSQILWARTNRICMLNGRDASRTTVDLLLEKPITGAELAEDGSIVTYGADGEVKKYRVIRFCAKESAGASEITDPEQENNSAYMDIEAAERKELEETLGRTIISKTPFPGGFAVAVTGDTVFLFHDGDKEPFKSVEMQNAGAIGPVAADGNRILAVDMTSDQAEGVTEIWDYEQELHYTNIHDYVADFMRFAEDGTLLYRRYAPYYGIDDVRKWVLDAPEPDEAAVSMLEALTSCTLDEELQTGIKDPVFTKDLGNWGTILDIQ